MARVWHETEQILQRFRNWLTQTSADLSTRDDSPGHSEPDAPPAAESPAVGLLQLVEAFTALRHELKLQTKSARGLEEIAQTSLSALDRAIAQFQGVPTREAQAADQAARPLVLSLIELDEALERGAKVIALLDRRLTERAPAELVAALDQRFASLSRWRRWLAAPWHRAVRQVCEQQVAATHQRVFSALMEGYQLTQSRLQRALAEQQIRRLDCIGREVDPASMTVVDLSDDPQAAPETVTAELRPGYTWRGAVIRYAEVRAVRRVRPLEQPAAEVAASLPDSAPLAGLRRGDELAPTDIPTG